MALHLVLAAIGFFFFYRLFCLARNYQTARQYGIPIIITPFCFEDAFWVVFRPYFSWVQRLPFGLGNWYVFSEMGWPQIDTNKTVERLGENFVLCAPTVNQIVTCYPPAVERVFGDHKNWPQTESQTRMFTVYGENVASTNGPDWQRHRKITATAFNENSMHEVWKEAIKRTQQMKVESQDGRCSLLQLRKGVEILAMGVLAAVAFGQEYELGSIPPGHNQSLMECLGFIHKHIILTILFSGLKAPNFLLPSVLRRLKVAVAEFRLYMEESLLKHLQTSREKPTDSRTTSLLESMVRANEAEKQELNKGASRPSYLSDSDLFGNLFVFNLAGYETTASTLTFALPYLASNPEIQDWVIEEIDKHFTGAAKPEYADIYPKLPRTLSIMCETLRLASPAPLLVRTPRSPCEIPIITPEGPRTIVVNSDTLVGGHFYGGHLAPTWGADVKEFNPKRFVSTSASGVESFTIPEGQMFLPWIFGQRVCPGKKFSQVEFTAIIAQLLSQYKLELVKEGSESQEQATERLLKVLEDKYFNISTHIRQPEAARLRFIKRG